MPRRSVPAGRALTGAVTAAILLTCGTPVLRAQSRGPSPVEVAAAQTRDVAPTIQLMGTVTPRLRTTVAAELAGLVTELAVEEGDPVRTGQVICKLRDEVRRLAHQEALAAQKRFELAISEWQAQLTRAEFEMRRLGELWKERQGTEREYIFAKADHDAALARLDQGKQELKEREAVVAILADNLARTEIRAPFDGFVVAKRTERGSWLVEGGPVVDLIALDVARVRVHVPESAAPYCAAGANVVIHVDAVGRDFAGRIGRLIPDAEPRARTFPVEVDVPNPDTLLKAGMFARAAMPSGPAGPRLVVPKDAVVRREMAALVFVVKPGEPGAQMAVPVPVRVQGELLDEVAIDADALQSGDLVVVRGNENLFGPSPVIPNPHQASPASQSAGANDNARTVARSRP